MKIFLIAMLSALAASCGNAITAPTCYYVVPNAIAGLPVLSPQESAKLFTPACQTIKLP